MTKTRAHAGVLALYAALTMVMLFPLSVQLADHVPDLGDPLEHTWTLAWNTHQLLLNPLELYNANIFYPYPNALAFSESQLATTVLAMPFVLATGNPLLAYNLVFVLSFVLSAFTCYLLAFDLTRSRWGGVLAGFAFAFWAYKFNHISHLNLVTLQWLPLVFLSLRWALDAGRDVPRTAPIAAALLFAVALTGQALSSWYYAVMTALGVALYLVYWVASRRRLPERRTVLALGAFSLPALALILAVAIPYFELSRSLDLARTIEDAQDLAARPISFITVAPGNTFLKGILPIGGAEALFAGFVVLALAVVGLVQSKGLPDRWFWLVLGVFFALLSFGPTFELAPNVNVPSPLYRLLYEFVPGMQGTRAPARFFVMTMLALCVFAAQGFRVLFENRSWRVRTLVGAAFVVLMALEYSYAPFPLERVATGAQIPPVYRWLAEQPRGTVVEMPRRGYGVTPLTQAMYYSTVHWQPTPLGYGSFAPPTFTDITAVLGDEITPPANRLLNFLREFDVRYWVFHSREYAPEEWERVKAGLDALQDVRLVWEQDDDSVYTVDGAAPEHPLAISTLLPRNATANAPYTAYLVLEQPRQYPIVNEDVNAKEFLVRWYRDGAVVESEGMSRSLPRVLRGRPEGIALETTAPATPGDYTVEVWMNYDPVASRIGNGNVSVSAATPLADTPFELLEISTSPQAPKSGENTHVTLWWRVREGVKENRVVYVGLEDAEGNSLFETSESPVLAYTYPTSQWKPGELIALEYNVPIPDDAARGEYALVVELTDTEATTALPFLLPTGEMSDRARVTVDVQ